MARQLPHDPAVTKTIIAVGRQMGAPQDVILSAIATNLVETGTGNNPFFGHGSSLGAFQQIKSWGPVEERMDVATSARKYYTEAIGLYRKGWTGSLGGLAQAVQKSAYPGRYDKRMDEARNMYAQYVGGQPVPTAQPTGVSGDPDDASALDQLLGIDEDYTRRRAQEAFSNSAQMLSRMIAANAAQGPDTVRSSLDAVPTPELEAPTDATTPLDVGAGGAPVIQAPSDAPPESFGAEQQGQVEAGQEMPGAGVPGDFVAPLSGKRTGVFGERRKQGHNHSGIDVAAPNGSPIMAAWGGTVKFAGKRGSYGNLVIIDHGGGRESYYAHQSAIGVRAGDRVAPGQRIGAVGNTGRSTGPHLHFEVRFNGKAVNPAQYWR